MTVFTRLALLSALLLLCPSPATAQTSTNSWSSYANQTQAGFTKAGLDSVKRQFDQLNSSAFMVIHQGHVVMALGDVNRRYMCHSMRKSIMNAMYGIYVEHGQIPLHATLGELGIDDKSGLNALEKQARVHDLLCSRSGVYHPAAYEPRSMRQNRPARGSSKPGATFFYNNWDFNTLVTIIEQVADIHFFEAVMHNIAQPLGMEDLRLEDMHFRYNPASIHPAYLFKMSTRDLARFGQLYLNKGRWKGQQIVPREWIEKSTRAFTTHMPATSAGSGYGYLWWVDQHSYRSHCYYASGKGGHKIFVFPEEELVIVHNVNTYLNQSVKEQDIRQLVALTLVAKQYPAQDSPTLHPLTIARTAPPIEELPAGVTDQYIGTYEHRFFGEIHVVQQAQQLFLKGNKLGSFRVFPKADDAFEVEDVPELQLLFKPHTTDQPKGQAITTITKDGMPDAFVLYY